MLRTFCPEKPGLIPRISGFPEAIHGYIIIIIIIIIIISSSSSSISSTGSSIILLPQNLNLL